MHALLGVGTFRCCGQFSMPRRIKYEMIGFLLQRSFATRTVHTVLFGAR